MQQEVCSKWYEDLPLLSTDLPRASWPGITSETASTFRTFDGADSSDNGSAVVLVAAVVGVLQRLTGRERVALIINRDAEQLVGVFSPDVRSTGENYLKTIEQQLSQSLPRDRTDLAATAGIVVVEHAEKQKYEIEGAGIQPELVFSADSSTIRLDYATTLFTEASANRMTKQVTRFADHFMNLPDQSVISYSLLDNEDESAVIEALTGPAGKQQPDPLDCFFHQVAVRPDAPALHYGEDTLGYGELGKLVDQLATVFIQHGVKPGDCVMMCTSPCIEAVATILAVFRVGAIWVPVDPAHPKERIARILEEINPALAIGQVEALNHANIPGSIALTFEQALASPLAVSPDFNNLDRSRSGYIFYTSGSTGVPKGVLCGMEQLGHYLGVARDRYGFCPEDIFSSIARYTFSISMWDLLSPLTVGASLLILDRSRILDIEQLAEALGRVTVAHVGPSLLRPLLRYLNSGEHPRKLSGMRHISSGGDIVPPDVMNQLQDAFPRAEVYVIYGCTEISCMGCTFFVPRDASVPKSFVGRPFPNVSIRLVDEWGRLVPPGVAGEILFAGPGLAEGYWRKPELTAEKFTEIDGQRFYRTGDMGRLSAEGDIEFLGRQDFQVQLRGIRIELGEIETTLRALPGIRDAVVAAKASPDGDKHLVGYVVIDEGSSMDAMSLRKELASTLPDYMLPQYFVFLDQLPLNPNMKVDRSALPEPQLSSGPGRAPVTSAESVLVESLGGLLGHDVDLDSSFVHNGGSSLTALELNNILRQQSGFEIPLTQLFSDSRLAELARRYANQQPGNTMILVDKSDHQLVLSSSQSRILFESTISDQSPAYLVPVLFEMRPGVDHQYLQQALQALVERHECLRYQIQMANGVFTPTICNNPALVLDEIVVSNESQKDEAVSRLAQQAFDLDRAPLMRSTLLRCDYTEADSLLLVFHHMVFDEASVNILLREIPALYKHVRGEGDPLPALPLDYSTYAISENLALENDFFSKQLHYWKTVFPQPPVPLDLPLDHPRPAQRRFDGKSIISSVGFDTVSSLRDVARAEQASLFHIIVGAWAQLLRGYSQQDEVTVGAALAGRNLLGSEQLVGCFINIVPIRLKVAINSRFTSWLAEVRDKCLEAMENGTVPFDQIVQEISPNRDMSRTPLYQTLVIHHLKQPAEPDDVLGLKEKSIMPSSTLTDLTLWVREERENIELILSYDTNLFDSQVVHSMLGQLKLGLEMLATQNVSLPLNFLGGDEVMRLRAFNDTEADAPESFLPLFIKSVAKHPDKTAVACNGLQLSYAELDQQATDLAGHLAGMGVGPGTLIGICLPRSINMLVATLGVLKAGAGYVPLDPRYPAARLEHMVKDSGLSFVICTADTKGFLPADTPLLEIDTLKSAGTESVERRYDPESIAYVIYTSGSTGTPKGVCVPHRAVANFLCSMARRPGMDASDVLVAVTTLSFDIAVLELFLPLISGACVVIATEDEVSDGNKLSRLLTEHDATMLQATPATWTMLLNTGHHFSSRLKGLCGGEPLARDLARRLIDQRLELWNMYGPTETTVWSSCDCIINPAKITLGKPIANTAFYILDEQLQRLPTGMPGELVIGGRGVTLGYLGLAEQTRDRFVPDPFAEAPGALMYRTGDKARLLPDGRFEYLGRIDNQVKLHGFRIELEEIESVAQMLGLGKACACVIQRAITGDQRLVLFVVDAEESRCNEYRKLLGQYLPHYMIPHFLVCVDQLPRTNNGKLDRKALASLQVDLSSTRTGEAVEPQDVTEHQVLTLFRKVLDDQSLGMDDNFFESGGHSLLAMVLTTEISNVFGIDFPVGLLFQAPSAAEVVQMIRNTPEMRPKPILLAGRQDNPAIFFLLGVHLYRHIALHLASDFSVYGVYVHRETDMTDKLKKAPPVEVLAEDYLQLIREQQPRGPYRLCGASFGGLVAYVVAQELLRQGETVELLMLFDTKPPLTLGRHLHTMVKTVPEHGFLKVARLSARRLVRKTLNLVKPVISRRSPSGNRDMDMLDKIRMNSYRQSAMDYADRISPYPGAVNLLLATRGTHPLNNAVGGWQALTRQLRVEHVKGDHLGILKKDGAKQVADIILRECKKAVE